MIKNNIFAFILNILISLITMFLYPRDYIINISLYIFILILYFLVTFLFAKNLSYFNFKIINLLSFSSLLLLAVILQSFGFVNYYFSFFQGLLLHASAPLIGNVPFDDTFLYSAILLLPNILLIWLGLETRKKWDNWRNKKSEEIVE